jgi:nitroreductase
MMNDIKKAQTQYPVLSMIRNRWSARSFSAQSITPEAVQTMIEAAGWAFSANNEQPWRYIVAHNGTPLFNTLLELLMPGNKPWCKNAAVLMLSLGKTISSSNQPNAYMLHDVGAANMLLTLQANSMDIYTHVMAGFNKEAAITALSLADELQPVAMIALGYLDDPEKLEEPFKTRELTPRTRHAVSSIILQYE